MTDELKPCPFCGGEAILCENFDYAYVYCKECGCQTDESHATARDAVDAWDTRYKRTCHVVSSRDYWDEYERYVTHVGWRLSCGHEAIAEQCTDCRERISDGACVPKARCYDLRQVSLEMLGYLSGIKANASPLKLTKDTEAFRRRLEALGVSVDG